MTAATQSLRLEETLLEPPALPPPPTRHALLAILIALAALLHVATIGSGDLYSETEGQYADLRCLSSLRATAQLTQLESRATRDVSAAEAAPAARAEFLQGVSFGWLRSFNAFFVGNNSYFTFAFGIMRGIGLVVFLPVIGQAQQFPRWHLDQREHLTALRNQRVVLRSCDPKSAPEPRTFYLIEPTLNHQPISKFSRTAIINLRTYHHGICLLFSHFGQAKAEFFGQMCARDLNETQISDVRHDASAVGVEKHHLHICADSRRSHSIL